MTEDQILLLNIGLYVAGLLFFIKKYGLISLPAVAMMLYLISSIFGYFYFISPFYLTSFAYEEYVLLPGVLWEFAFNFLFAWMLRTFTFYKTGELLHYNEKLVNNIQKTLNVIFIISAIFILPSAISNLSGVDDLSELRDSTYETGNLVEIGFPINLISRFFSEMTPFLLAIPLFNIIVRKKARKIDYLSIALFLTSIMTTMGSFISRSVIISTMIYVIILIVVLHRFLNAKYVRIGIFVALPVIILFYSVFSAISASRFSTGVGDVEEAGANLRYLGEPQVDFAAIMYDKVDEHTYGYRSLSLIRRIAGLNYYGEQGSDREKNLEYLDNRHQYPNYIFYSAAGEAYMDWGPIAPLVVLGAINLLLMRRRRKDSFDFYKYILSIVVAYYFIMGMFFVQYYSEAGNSLMVVMIILFFMSRKYQPQPMPDYTHPDVTDSRLDRLPPQQTLPEGDKASNDK